MKTNKLYRKELSLYKELAKVTNNTIVKAIAVAIYGGVIAYITIAIINA